MERNQENKTKLLLGGRNFDSKLREGLRSRNFEQIESVYTKISLNNKLACYVDRDKFAAAEDALFESLSTILIVRRCTKAITTS